MATIYPLVGSAIALAGADKLAGDRSYVGLYRHFGWSDEQRRAAAITETAGGLLMVPRSTRRIGGLLLAAVSVVTLISELKEGDTKLAAARALVLASALGAVLKPGPK